MCRTWGRRTQKQEHWKNTNGFNAKLKSPWTTQECRELNRRQSFKLRQTVFEDTSMCGMWTEDLSLEGNAQPQMWRRCYIVRATPMCFTPIQESWREHKGYRFVPCDSQEWSDQPEVYPPCWSAPEEQRKDRVQSKSTGKHLQRKRGQLKNESQIPDRLPRGADGQHRWKRGWGFILRGVWRLVMMGTRLLERLWRHRPGKTHKQSN